MTEVFISHSSEDKAVVDVLVDFMLRCGIHAKSIFCSSLSGNGVQQKIPGEVKRALDESKINIAVLSTAYYRSAYCQNEVGIIWYQQDIPAVVIALPEITHTDMQGFLNGENIVRRLDNREHIMEIADVIKNQCEDFDCNAAKMSINADKLIKEYNESIRTRAVPERSANVVEMKNGGYGLEQRILSNEFSDGEIVFFKYFYDTQCREVLDDMLDFNEWYLRESYVAPMGDTPLITLKEEGIVEEIFEEYTRQWVGYRLTVRYYRQLRKISSNCYDYICGRLNQHGVSSKGMRDGWNTMDWCVHNKLSEGEKLLLQYVRAKKRKELFTGWKATREIDSIKNWEDFLQIDNYMSNNYREIVDGLFERKWLVVSEVTEHGNARAYSWTDTAITMILNLHEDTEKLLRETVQLHGVL